MPLQAARHVVRPHWPPYHVSSPYPCCSAHLNTSTCLPRHVSSPHWPPRHLAAVCPTTWHAPTGSPTRAALPTSTPPRVMPLQVASLATCHVPTGRRATCRPPTRAAAPTSKPPRARPATCHIPTGSTATCHDPTGSPTRAAAPTLTPQRDQRQRCASTRPTETLAPAPTATPPGRGLHSSTCRINVSASCGKGGALGAVKGVVLGVEGYLRVVRVYFVSSTAQVELKSRRV
jgi:hypothetical protein